MWAAIVAAPLTLPRPIRRDHQKIWRFRGERGCWGNQGRLANSGPGVSITGGIPGTTNYSAMCGDHRLIVLTAPAAVTAGGVDYRFQRWELDGDEMPCRQRTLELVADGPKTAMSVWHPAADVNGDCRVNVLDLIFIRNRLNADVNTDDNWKADVNQDDKINVLDLIYVRNRLNTGCP